jgi:hypothetical protein
MEEQLKIELIRNGFNSAIIFLIVAIQIVNILIDVYLYGFLEFNPI